MTAPDKSNNLRSKILNYLAEHSQKTFTVKDLLVHLGLQAGDRDILLRELKQMAADGQLVKIARGGYGLPERLGYHTGVLQGNRRGFAFLRPDNRAEDIFIKAANLQSAVHGDRVVVRLTGGRGKRRRREGEVIGILKRGSNRMVGTLEQHGKRFYVIPDDNRYSFIIQVPRTAIQPVRGQGRGRGAALVPRQSAGAGTAGRKARRGRFPSGGGADPASQV